MDHLEVSNSKSYPQKQQHWRSIPKQLDIFSVEEIVMQDRYAWYPYEASRIIQPHNDCNLTQSSEALVWLRRQATYVFHVEAAVALFLCQSNFHGLGFQWWPTLQANGNSTRIMKDDFSASLRYCTVPFIIFTSF
ncbi:hypothetical protein QQP08_001318 [Theobroma cacao]|nr:hypothetical protein QQP08_001318 [Theobroma cacao]